MERLTHERLNGIRDGYWSPNKKQELVDRLAAYENTNLDPEQVKHVKETAKKYLLEKAQGKVGGWIPVEERLPEVGEDTEETIEDDDCPEYIVTIRGASESTVLKYSPDGAWFDENGYVYDVIAWRPLPEPYKPKQPETCKYTGGSCCWPIDQCSDCPNNPERSENDQ